MNFDHDPLRWANQPLLRFPRTPHLEDSRLSADDDPKGRARLSSLRSCWMVVEEKADAGNMAVSFSPAKDLLLQSRGHFLVGGASEAQFSIAKSWANAHSAALWEALGDRYVMYGENMQALHTLYYNNLPHIFLEFDVFDRERQVFLNTAQRQLLLKDAPVVSVPVLWEGWAPSSMKHLKALVKGTGLRSGNWREDLALARAQAGIDPEAAALKDDPSDDMEGLYIKIETEQGTVARFKWVRQGFVQTILEGDEHWAKRPMVLNGLDPRVDLYDTEISWPTPGLFGRDGFGGFVGWAQSPPPEAKEPELKITRAPRP
jgi:hypothetical protein